MEFSTGGTVPLKLTINAKVSTELIRLNVCNCVPEKVVVPLVFKIPLLIRSPFKVVNIPALALTLPALVICSKPL